MEMSMKAYTVHQLASLAGVSVRTLHHYDQIGLLKPGARSAAGYRQYGEQDLLRLQQVLFFKELDFPLSSIQEILDQPGFDQVAALRDHRRMLEGRAERLSQLIRTIDKTITHLTEDKMELSDAELYEGFSQEQMERYQREAREKWGAQPVEESEVKLKKMSKQQWQALKQEGDDITRQLAALADRHPGDPEVQAAIARHHAMLMNFYPASVEHYRTAEFYRGLGQLYTDHPEFRAFYERYRPNMADFMRTAMEYYSDHTLAK